MASNTTISTANQIQTDFRVQQSLTPEAFAKLSPWSDNAPLDAEMQRIAVQIYDTTLGQNFTDEEAVYQSILSLSVRASQMQQILLSEPDAPDLDFEIVYDFLKERVSQHLHDKIWKDSVLLDMSYNFVPNHQLVETILKDEMLKLWFDGTFEQALNDDYRRCLDLWRNGERTYFAPADIQKWAGVLRSFDMSNGINYHPVKTVSIGTFAAVTAPLSWTYALLWSGGAAVNAGIQYQNASLAEEYANINQSPDAYETANREYGQAFGMGAQAAIPLAVRYMSSSGVAETTTLVSRSTPSELPVSTQPALNVIPAPRQITGPVAVSETAPQVTPQAHRIIFETDAGVQVLKPSTTPPQPEASFSHPASSAMPIRSALPKTLVRTMTPNDVSVESLLHPLDFLEPTSLVVIENAVQPLRTPTLGQAPVMNLWPVPILDVDVLPDDPEAYPRDAFGGRSHEDDGRFTAAPRPLVSTPQECALDPADETLDLAGRSKRTSASQTVKGTSAKQPIVINSPQRVSIPMSTSDWTEFLATLRQVIRDPLAKAKAASAGTTYFSYNFKPTTSPIQVNNPSLQASSGILEIGQDLTLMFPIAALEVCRAAGPNRIVTVTYKVQGPDGTPMSLYEITIDRKKLPAQVSIRSFSQKTPQTEQIIQGYINTLNENLIKQGVRNTMFTIVWPTPKDVKSELLIHDGIGAVSESLGCISINQNTNATRYQVTSAGTIQLQNGITIHLTPGMVFDVNTNQEANSYLLVVVGSMLDQATSIPVEIAGQTYYFAIGETDDFIVNDDQTIVGTLASPITVNTIAGPLLLPADTFIQINPQGQIEIKTWDVHLYLRIKHGQIVLISRDEAESLNRNELMILNNSGVADFSTLEDDSYFLDTILTLYTDGSIEGYLAEDWRNYSEGQRVLINTDGTIYAISQQLTCDE